MTVQLKPSGNGKTLLTAFSEDEESDQDDLASDPSMIDDNRVDRVAQ